MFSVKNQNKRMIDLRGVCLCLPVVRSTIEAFLGIHERKRKQLVQKMTRPVILRTTFLTLKSPNKCPKLVIYLLSPVLSPVTLLAQNFFVRLQKRNSYIL